MSKPLRVSDEAVADLNAVARWYGERSLKAADGFNDEVKNPFNSSGVGIMDERLWGVLNQ